MRTICFFWQMIQICWTVAAEVFKTDPFMSHRLQQVVISQSISSHYCSLCSAELQDNWQINSQVETLRGKIARWSTKTFTVIKKETFFFPFFRLGGERGAGKEEKRRLHFSGQIKERSTLRRQEEIKKLLFLSFVLRLFGVLSISFKLPQF